MYEKAPRWRIHKGVCPTWIKSLLYFLLRLQILLQLDKIMGEPDQGALAIWVTTVLLLAYPRAKVESELNTVCAGILKLLDSSLVPSASNSESKVFYLKMKGEYHRYLAEFKVGDERKEAADDTMNSYKAAQDGAEES